MNKFDPHSTAWAFSVPHWINRSSAKPKEDDVKDKTKYTTPRRFLSHDEVTWPEITNLPGQTGQDRRETLSNESFLPEEEKILSGGVIIERPDASSMPDG